MESFRRRLGAGYGEPVSLGSSSRSSGNDWFTEVRPKREPMDEPGTLGPSGSPGVLSSRNWTIDNLQKRGKRFKAVRRISALLPEPTLLRILEEHETLGVPLIVENWHCHPRWPSNLFNLDWLLKHCGDHKWQVRDVRSCTDKNVTLREFIEWSRARGSAGVPNSDQLLYGKDAPCPPEWREWVNSGDLLPSALCPHGGNDLLQNLTKTEEVESLMCYLGIGDTFTPCHKDLCASSGQNIMCYTEEGGSSFWFMTSSSDAPSAAEYFQKHIGQELDWEAHAVTVEEFANAPFTVYIAEQKLGDLVLVPPRSCHQVVNHGGLTVKTSWSRMTLEGLAIALHHELPIYRRVCRPEQYRVKHIIYRSLLRGTSQIRLFHSHVQHGFNSPPPRDRIPSLDVYLRAQGACMSQMPSDGSHTDIPSRRRGQLSRMASDLRMLIGLFDSILHEEYSPAHKDLPTIFASTSTLSKLGSDELPVIFASRTPSKRQPKLSLKASSGPNHGADRQHQSSAAHNLACDFCGADIFQSFFECRQCRPMHDSGDDAEDDEEGQWQYGDGLLICCHCYAEGRTCLCQTSMYAVQCRPFGDLLRDRNEAVTVLEALADIQLGSQSRHTLLSEHQLSGYSHLNVFAAGCRLSSLRDQASTTTRKCRCGHSGPPFEVIYCNACHTSKCFKELLRAGLHSAEVILRGLGGGSAFHDLHRETRVDFRGSITRLQSAERSGEVIGHKDRLVFVAQRYSACRPMNPNNVHQGWYDEQPSVNAHITNPQTAPPTKVKDRSEVAPTAISLSCTDRNPSLASTNSTVTPLHLPKVSHPTTKLVAEVVLVSRKRAQIQSRTPSSSLSTSQSMSGSKDHPPEDENSEQGLGISLAKAMNAAISHEARPTSSHVRRGRIYSSSPESTPAHAADTFDVQERPPPPKKRKLAREIAAPSPPAKGASSAAGASSSGMKGTRGRPPGRRSLRSDNSNAIKVDEPAVAESSTSASVLVCPPTAPLPFNQNAFVGELFLQLSAAQQAAGLRSYANEAQAIRASVAEQIDPVARKVVELEQAFKKIEALEQSMVIKDQEQEKDAAKTRQQNVLLTTRVSQLESTVERLEKQTRQQESEIQHLRDANDKAESHAIEFDKKMKEELGEATREVREKYEIVKLLIDLKKSPQAPIPTEANSMQSAPPVLMSHGTMPTMSMTAQAGVTDGAQGMLQQESPIRQYHTPYQNRRGGYIPRGRGGRPGFSTYHSPPGTHRYGHHMQGSERYDHHQDGPSPFTNAYRARGDNDGVHATTSYGGHKESRAHGHHQEHKPYHSKPQLAEQPCGSQKYDDGSGGARRHKSRWDQGSKPEYSRAETSRGTPYERESTVSSGQTAQPSPRSRSPSKEPAISLDGSPSRGNSPMRGRSRSRKADSDSSYEP